ncbi:MAG: hypothetical protein WCA19_02100 [Candidatus Acidiferrales bacterium]
MDFHNVVAVLNKLLLQKRPETFNSSWVLKHAPACYRFIRNSIRTEVGNIDWDKVTHALEPQYQRRWTPRLRKKYRAYRNAIEIDLILNKYRNMLYVFIAPANLADRQVRDKIAIDLVRVAQKGNLLAKVEVVRLVRFTIDDWIDKYNCLSRWKGYNDEILEQIEGCVRRYRYTGSFFTYLFRTLEYAGRGICPIVTSSLDGPIASNACKRKIENVVYDPETNEIGFYDPKKLFSFDSESQFGV